MSDPAGLFLLFLVISLMILVVAMIAHWIADANHEQIDRDTHGWSEWP